MWYECHNKGIALTWYWYNATLSHRSCICLTCNTGMMYAYTHFIESIGEKKTIGNLYWIITFENSYSNKQIGSTEKLKGSLM